MNLLMNLLINAFFWLLNVLERYAFQILLGSIFFVGFALIPDAWPKFSLGLPEKSRNEVGAALLGGAAIGLAILGAEHALEKRQDHEGLRLQLGLGKKFPGIDLSGRDLNGFYLRGKILANANLTLARLNEAKLHNADLTGADLTEARLFGADLSEAKLIGANLTEASLLGASLEGAILKRAILTEANLTLARLNEAKLKRAILDGADLTMADLSGADLRYARYTEKTVWPAGYPSDGKECTPDSRPELVRF